MQSHEETFLGERIAAIIVPVHMARHNRKWDSARLALKAIPGANVNDVDLCKNRTFCCGSGVGCFWEEEVKDPTRINHMRFDQIAVANPETLAVGFTFCMVGVEGAVECVPLPAQTCVRRVA